MKEYLEEIKQETSDDEAARLILRIPDLIQDKRCLFGIVSLTIIAGIWREAPTVEYHTGRFMTAGLMLLMTNFILTIFMVLKRMHALLTQALKDKPIKKTA